MGIDAVLTKPVKQSLLYNTIASHYTSLSSVSEAVSELVEPELSIDVNSVKLLLVEDHNINQRVAMGILKGLGITADIAQNGQEAVQAVSQIHYDIILMDIQMPVMDGYEATHAIRQQEGDTHNVIIAMTANAMQGDREKCLAAGMDDYISKPIKVEELVACIERHLGEQQQAKTG